MGISGELSERTFDEMEDGTSLVVPKPDTTKPPQEM